MKLLILFTFCITWIHCSSFDYGYGSYYRKHELSEIPQLGSKNPMENLAAELKNGEFYYETLVKADKFKTTVFKVQLERERIILADPIAVRVMYDVRKVDKVIAANALTFNNLSTNGYLPSIMDNGE